MILSSDWSDLKCLCIIYFYDVSVLSCSEANAQLQCPTFEKHNSWAGMEGKGAQHTPRGFPFHYQLLFFKCGSVMLL